MADSSETDKNIEMWKIKRVRAAGFWAPLGARGTWPELCVRTQ